ncbi:MAG: ABC transporter permease [Candidatus Gastranaerophilales bacterium]|nr:ABC transporter permease [Candidatus Gastranaerophilales bacterium]
MKKDFLTILKIWKTELIAVLTDPATVLIMIIALFMYSMFYSIPYSHEVAKNIPISAVDNDNSVLSRKLIKDINSTDSVDIVSQPVNKNEAQVEFYKGKTLGFIVIPKDFEKHLLEGKKTQLSLYADSGYLVMYKQVAGGVMSTAMTLSSGIEVNKLRMAGVTKKQALGVVRPFISVDMPLFNPSGGYETYIFPVVLVLIMQQTLLVGVGVLGGTKRERKGAFCKVASEPWQIVLGNSLAYVTLYLSHSIFFFIVIPLLFSFRAPENIPLLALCVFPFLFAVSFLAQALTIFFNEREDGLMFVVVLSLPMVFVPGFVWPKEAIPTWLNFVADFVPATRGIDAIVRINQFGASFAQVKWDFVILIALCFLYFLLACLAIKHVCIHHEEN